MDAKKGIQVAVLGIHFQAVSESKYAVTGMK